ncbi:hypothetical protein BGX23_006692 [Mortierella sp. AD031]|nr:hypothetical protein BGX23_006692 [Mortierella sp. AD031]KAG0207486.1 hypothetical protein BGX33_006816 [Mortierella sp. NVP41]
MFQCPMEKCPKSFARAYNLHIHLKTQHHLASKELAAVSPLRAPPSAPPVQIITPEEAAAGVTPSNIATVRAGTTTLATATTATDTKQSNLRSTVTGDNNDRNSNSSGNTTSTTTGYYDVSNAGPDNGSLDCDSSCASSATGVTSSIAGGQGRSFPCHLCPRIFSRKHDLHRHIRVHTGSKPYLCTNCRKAFARTDALCRHYKVEDDCRQVLVELEAAPEDEDSLMQQQLQQHRFHQQRQPGSEY